MTALADAGIFERWTLDVAQSCPRTAVSGIDVSRVTRPRALRSKLQQAMAKTADAIYSRDVPRALLTVWTGDEPAGDRLREAAFGAGASLHRHSEMTRGCPLGLTIVFTEAATPGRALGSRLRADGGLAREGIAVVDWWEVCAQGVRASAAAARL